MPPSCAVTSTLTAVLLPTPPSARAALSEPLASVDRFVPMPTFTVALDSFTVGLSFTCVTPVATLAV